MRTLWNDFFKGIWEENPTWRQLLGTCPTLAVTTSATNGLVMGLATAVCLILSSVMVSIIRSIVPDEVRIPVYVVLIATFVTITDLFLEATVPDIHAVLGLFIPLIVVNCIILGRAEAFASKVAPHRAATDALGMGLGFTWALTAIGSVRELLGLGSIFGMKLMPAGFTPWGIMILPPGAFLTMGSLLGLMNWITRRSAAKAASR
ncbi:MAG: electron transport complex subunit RsxE [Limnochordia bacterium]|jgi:electron transport complex protein RnfE